LIRVISRNESHEELEYSVKLSILGPSHISLSLAPLQSDSTVIKLHDWSLKIPINDVERIPSSKQPKFNGSFEYTYDKWYFVYRYMGVKPEPWNLSINLKLLKKRIDEKFEEKFTKESIALELGLSGHYLPAEKVGRCETRQMENMREKLHDWISMICMESVYHNYLF